MRHFLKEDQEGTHRYFPLGRRIPLKRQENPSALESFHIKSRTEWSE